MSRSGSILVNISELALVVAVAAVPPPHTQLVLVSLLDDEDEAADEDEALEHPVLFIHNVCRLNLPSSYGSDVAVVVADFSLVPDSLRRPPLLLLLLPARLEANSLDLKAHTSKPTMNTTDTAPINEPSSVCFNSDVVKTNEDATAAAERSVAVDSSIVLNSGISLL